MVVTTTSSRAQARQRRQQLVFVGSRGRSGKQQRDGLLEQRGAREGVASLGTSSSPRRKS